MEYVLITGATSGIGYELAKKFADKKCSLLLCARNEIKLAHIKNNLEQRYRVKILTYKIDLSSVEETKDLCMWIKKQKIDISILINNAGAGYTGEFIEEEIEKDLDIINLNMVSLTYLCKEIGKSMALKKSGKILNVASTGSFHSGPYTAVYYATKAYVLSFSEALSHELKEYNVTVSALCPGATKTNFAKSAGRENNKNAMSPEFVADKAYEGLMKSKTTIIPGLKYKLFVLLPRKLIIPFAGRYQKKLKNLASEENNLQM